jgi:hypothetical protein
MALARNVVNHHLAAPDPIGNSVRRQPDHIAAAAIAAWRGGVRLEISWKKWRAEAVATENYTYALAL